MTTTPTVFHVTNYKAGSQWVAEVLKHSAPERFVKPDVAVRHFFEKAISPGKVYPTVYVTRPQFLWTLLGYQRPATYPKTHILKNYFASVINQYHFHVAKYPYRVFVVIRDLRDILVSQYFSLLVSHPEVDERVSSDRKILSSSSLEDGMLYLLDDQLALPLQAQIQYSWVIDNKQNGVLLMRFEDLLADEFGSFNKIVDHCQIAVDASKLHYIVSNNSFSTVTGRERGQENIKSHYRKGISGDWKNHFTDRIKAEFKTRYGQILINTGYEQDMNW
jgi:lipopolysaccharide transport system ATP-binding protein